MRWRRNWSATPPRPKVRRLSADEKEKRRKKALIYRINTVKVVYYDPILMYQGDQP
jgi:hypothetical protein